MADTHTHTHIHTYIHTYTHTHTHTFNTPNIIASQPQLFECCTLMKAFYARQSLVENLQPVQYTHTHMYVCVTYVWAQIECIINRQTHIHTHNTRHIIQCTHTETQNTETQKHRTQEHRNTETQKHTQKHICTIIQYPSYIIYHASCIIYHTLYIIHHTSQIIHNTS